MSKLTTGIAIAGLLSPAGTQALGVGDIKLQSYLNQPLRAEIPLVLSQERLADVKIQLAPAKDFNAAGLERPHVLTKLRFEPAPTPDGGFVIRVGSTESIHEPILSFLVELTWPEGRLLRNFTVLLDPPDVLAQPSFPQRPFEVAFSGSDKIGASSGRPRPAARPDSTSLLATAVLPASPEASQYGPVGRNEKLWAIAERLNQDPSITQEQMVIALLRANPHAFSRPNVNALNAGAMLRIPTREEILQISPALAKEEFYRHLSGHTARRLRSMTPIDGVATSPGSDAEPPVRDSEPRARAVQPVQPPGSAESEWRVLQRENLELRHRLSDLESRVAELQLLIAEKTTAPAGGSPAGAVDSKTAAEPDQLKRAEPASSLTDGTPKLTDAGDRALSPATGPATASQPASSEASGRVSSPAPEPAAKQTGGQDRGGAPPPPASATEPLRVPAESAARPSALSDSQAEHPVLWSLAGVGAALASLTGVYYARRRRVTASDPDVNRAAADAPAPAAANTLTSSGTELQPAVTTRDKSDGDEVDPLFEADIYLSYGKHGQAQETVENAIRKHPAREAYRLKLLEILLIRGDTDRFETEISHLRTDDRFADPAFWDQARTLAARLHAGSLLDQAISTVAASPAPVAPSGETDQTDRLIDDLKRFSLEIREEAAKAAAHPDTENGTLRHDTLGRITAEPLNDPHHIPWSPAEPGNFMVASPAGETEADVNPTEDADRLIEFAPAAAPTGTAAQTLEDIASESIDSLLKELSAMHYQEHRTGEESTARLSPTPSTAESKNTELGGPEDAAAALNVADGLMESEPAVEQDVEAAVDVETKLDLARAYADMGDLEQAREFLDEVMHHGSEPQKTEAAGILATLARA